MKERDTQKGQKVAITQQEEQLSEKMDLVDKLRELSRFQYLEKREEQ